MINFPSNPTIGQQHTYQSKTWSWTGVAWTRVDETAKTITMSANAVGSEAARPMVFRRRNITSVSSPVLVTT